MAKRTSKHKKADKPQTTMRVLQQMMDAAKHSDEAYMALMRLIMN
ncbi:MAG: hypothetical protein ACXVNN_05235 [Bacteroidia bacterium]